MTGGEDKLNEAIPLFEDGGRWQSSESRWYALVDREREADGQFWYGVITTRIYCRPHCPSRLPRSGNVRFFNSQREARAAGLRPCKRCRPDDHRPGSME